MNVIDRLKSKRVAIVTHVYATGPAQELEDFLKDKVLYLLFIGHPFSFAKDIRSFYKVYSGGRLFKEVMSKEYRFPDILLYFKDFFLSLVWIIKDPASFDLYIGLDPLNALAGIILKKINKVKKVVYYTIDYTPKRFENPVLNAIYHKIDNYCVLKSDRVWNLSDKMTEARKRKGIYKTAHQKVVPIGVNQSRINITDIGQINRHNLVYMGHVKKRQGLELAIESLPDIIGRVSDARLVIIGSGELEEYIKYMVQDLNLDKYVEFKGYINDHREVEELLSKNAIGLALYEPHPDSVTWYADSSKPKQYMACGLPIIITRVAQISDDVIKNQLGLVIEYNKSDFVKAATRLLEEDELYKNYRNNAIRYASNFQWDKIFSTALAEIVDG